MWLIDRLPTKDEPGVGQVPVVGEVGSKLEVPLELIVWVVLHLDVLVDTVVGG